MKGLIYYINKILGRVPTETDKSFAKKELEYFMRGRGATHRFVRPGERFRKPWKKKKKLKVGESERIGRFYKYEEK